MIIVLQKIIQRGDCITMVISFMVLEARHYLEDEGFVCTLRPSQRKRTGKDWYNHFRGDTKKGNVNIEYLGDYSSREILLDLYVKASGFNSRKVWLEKAGNSRHLYLITLLRS